MENELTKLISRFLTLSEDEKAAFIECIPIKNFDKGTILLRERQVSRASYFIIEGCVRKYYLVNGEEKTTNFYVEDEAVSSLYSYMNKVPSTHYFECVEDCKLAVLSFDNEQKLFKRVPRYESLCRNSVENDFGMQQEALANFMTNSPEDRYRNLLENRFDLVNRIPQYHLATYLGVKPESLSRIRKRIASK